VAAALAAALGANRRRQPRLLGPDPVLNRTALLIGYALLWCPVCNGRMRDGVAGAARFDCPHRRRADLGDQWVRLLVRQLRTAPVPALTPAHP
jgi:hypothetical protein